MKIHPLNLGFSMAYLLEDDAGVYLVDAGLKGQENRIMRDWEKTKKPLNLIFITHAHCDHYGSAAAVRRLTGARIAIHDADAVFMEKGETPMDKVYRRAKLLKWILLHFERFLTPKPTLPDILLQDGDSLAPYGIPASVLHTPGHTPGSCCLSLEDGSLFAGDMVSNDSHAHLQEYFIMDEQAMRASYVKMKAARFSRIFCGHGNQALSGDALQKLLSHELGEL
jgi:hydroxyacylglutathione hydrolase